MLVSADILPLSKKTVPLFIFYFMILNYVKKLSARQVCKTFSKNKTICNVLSKLRRPLDSTQQNIISRSQKKL